MNGGVFVYVPKDVVVEEPLQVLFLHDDAQASLFNHVIVVADANSSLTYVENYLSTVEEAAGQANIIAEVFAGDNSKIIYGAVDVLAKGLHDIRQPPWSNWSERAHRMGARLDERQRYNFRKHHAPSRKRFFK